MNYGEKEVLDRDETGMVFKVKTTTTTMGPKRARSMTLFVEGAHTPK